MQLAMFLKIRVSVEFKRQNNAMGTRITIQVPAMHTVREAYRYTAFGTNDIVCSPWGSKSQSLFYFWILTSKFQRLQYFKETKLFKDSTWEVYEILCDRQENSYKCKTELDL